MQEGREQKHNRVPMILLIPFLDLRSAHAQGEEQSLFTCSMEHAEVCLPGCKDCQAVKSEMGNANKIWKEITSKIFCGNVVLNIESQVDRKRVLTPVHCLSLI